jgi:hypothetical protein
MIARWPAVETSDIHVEQQMKTKSSALIAALMMTAIVLSAILLTVGSRRAEAGMINAQPDVTMMVAPSNGSEPLIIIDKLQGKMVVYDFSGSEFKVTGTSRLAGR